jgi:hypothetical protein
MEGDRITSEHSSGLLQFYVGGREFLVVRDSYQRARGLQFVCATLYHCHREAEGRDDPAF